MPEPTAPDRADQPPLDIVLAVKTAIRKLLRTHRVGAARTARLLKLSTRTLQRRLSERGTTFAAVLRETRLELVAEHLTREGMTVTRMADVLGLSEASAVSRFMKKSAGVTPKSIKARARAERATVARKPPPR